jgi:hypothetical protein
MKQRYHDTWNHHIGAPGLDLKRASRQKHDYIVIFRQVTGAGNLEERHSKPVLGVRGHN